jgi:hypothetical protein
MKYLFNGIEIDSNCGSPNLGLLPGEEILVTAGDVVNGFFIPVNGTYNVKNDEFVPEIEFKIGDGIYKVPKSRYLITSSMMDSEGNVVKTERLATEEESDQFDKGTLEVDVPNHIPNSQEIDVAIKTINALAQISSMHGLHTQPVPELIKVISYLESLK